MRNIKSGVVLTTGLLWAVLSNAQDFGGTPMRDNPPPKKEEFFRVDNGFMGISGGFARPIGEFASKDYLNYYSGYAETGWCANIFNGHRKFTNNFGLGLSWTHSRYGYNVSALKEPYALSNPDLDFSAEYETGWVINSILGAFVVTVPSKYFDLDVKLNIGAGVVRRPEIYMEGWERATGFLVWSWLQEESTKTDLMLGGGINGRIHLTNDLDLLFQGDYHRMRTNFTITNIYSRSFYDEEILRQSIEYVTLAVGFGLRL